LSTGCGTKSAEMVNSCDECRSYEYCVKVESENQLYCSEACVSHWECVIDQWCVPERDEVYTDNVTWVCMPDKHYSTSGKVWYWGTTSCVADGSRPCDSGMQCLVDDSENPDVYFCADECSNHTDCISDCCYNYSRYESYCAPMYPYCRSGIKEVYYWGNDNCTEVGNECPSGMECVVDETQNPYIYYCSEACVSGDECVTGCCPQSTYCAPEHGFCD